MKSVIEEVLGAHYSTPVTIHHSEINIGGFGRFELASQLAGATDRVVFIDDDVNFSNDALQRLCEEYQPRTIRSFYAFQLNNPADYFARTVLDPGHKADYCGTGGMICDSSIFKEKGLFACPKEYWFIEDLWLSYYAKHIMGWELYKSGADISIMPDQKNQWYGLRDKKSAFLKYLTQQGWQLKGNNFPKT